ncbi:MAG TPA: gamma carbonic anhydrase family protein [Anaerolineae bacterium]|nr:gamma carbonic anhydrase family protein [Anaerolineae bacterium]
MDNSRHPELIAPDVFIAPSADIVGQVSIGAESSVWFGSILRGDTDRIVIGRRSNLQDGCIVHVDAGSPTLIGDGVTVAHRAVVHGCVVEDDVLIGMGALVLTGARIGRESIIGAGALVTGGTVVPPRSLVLGLPGRVVREVTDEELESVRRTAQRYLEYARQYRGR